VHGFFGYLLPVEKLIKKPAPYLNQFQFVMPVIIKDFFMFTASNDQEVMNLKIFR